MSGGLLGNPRCPRIWRRLGLGYDLRADLCIWSQAAKKLREMDPGWR